MCSSDARKNGAITSMRTGHTLRTRGMSQARLRIYLIRAHAADLIFRLSWRGRTRWQLARREVKWCAINLISMYKNDPP